MLVQCVLLGCAKALVLGLSLLCESFGLVKVHFGVNAGSLFGNTLFQRLGDGGRLGLC
jgi:hypothetical protein